MRRKANVLRTVSCLIAISLFATVFFAGCGGSESTSTATSTSYTEELPSPDPQPDEEPEDKIPEPEEKSEIKWRYTVTGPDTAVLTGYNEASGVTPSGGVKIPEKVDGYTITGIQAKAFYKNTELVRRFRFRRVHKSAAC